MVERHQLRTIIAFKVPMVQPMEALPLVSIVSVMTRNGRDIGMQFVVVEICARARGWKACRQTACGQALKGFEGVIGEGCETHGLGDLYRLHVVALSKTT